MDYRKTSDRPRQPHVAAPHSRATVGPVPTTTTASPPRPTTTTTTMTRPTPDLCLPNYATPPLGSVEAVRGTSAVDLSVSEHQTGKLHTPDELYRLQQSWLRRPTYPIEYTPGWEGYADYLAAWHDEQRHLRAEVLGCSHRMARILEELCWCWLENRPPESFFAKRLILEY